MKYLVFLASLLGLINKCDAQKTLVNDTTYKNWTTVEDGNLSSDGRYIYYRINNTPVGGNTWVILSKDKKWEYHFNNVNNLKFSLDNKNLYAMQGETLIKLKLGSNSIVGIPKCKDYELYSKGKSEWIVYSLDNIERSLIIENLNTKKQIVLNNIQYYYLNQNGATMVTKLYSSDERQETMNWTDMVTGVSKNIYKGLPTKDLIFDQSGNHFAFNILGKENEIQIWCYDRSKLRAEYIANDSAMRVDKNLKIAPEQLWRFSEDGQNLFFYLTKTSPEENKTKGPDIWNYKDLFLLSEYKNISGTLHEHENLSILNIHRRKIRQLLSGDQTIVFESSIRKNSNVFIVQSSYGGMDELSWNKKSRLSYYLCFSKTGELIPIKENCKRMINTMGLSPDNQFLVYYDPEELHYVSYNIKDRRRETISGPLNKELYSVVFASRLGLSNQGTTFGIIGWIEGKKKILVHGSYDIWELDLENKSNPKNITQGAGEKNHVIFSDLPTKILNTHGKWLLSAFNMRTKDSELYSFDYNSGQLLQLFKSESILASGPIDQPRLLKKASKENAYLLKLGNAKLSPNFVYTSNFKKLDTLSANYPEKKYNWLSSELITYPDQFGRECQGILYKPENFDSTKRYPVIFYYYVEMANGLNKPLDVSPSNIGFNIPLLVSNGYVVCTPNIYIEPNKPGESALISVTAASDYLKRFSWIDSTKMGIIGHSRGGYETNYIVTHCNRYTAAISCAGISNLVEYYNSINTGGGGSNHDYVRGQMQINGRLDEVPEVYTENSPIMKSSGCSTPLLLMHNEGDYTVSVSQSTQFFLQLRSMQKAVWLLQYDNENHALHGDNRIDFQNKIKDFFDHYLKGKSVPQWMDNPIKQ